MTTFEHPSCDMPDDKPAYERWEKLALELESAEQAGQKAAAEIAKVQRTTKRLKKAVEAIRPTGRSARKRKSTKH